MKDCIQVVLVQQKRQDKCPSYHTEVAPKRPTRLQITEMKTSNLITLLACAPDLEDLFFFKLQEQLNQRSSTEEGVVKNARKTRSRQAETTASDIYGDHKLPLKIGSSRLRVARVMSSNQWRIMEDGVFKNRKEKGGAETTTSIPLGGSSLGHISCFSH